MMGSFNDEEEGLDQEAVQAPTAPIPPPMVAPQQRAPTMPRAFAADPLYEIQRRLELAACYQVLLGESLFEEETPITNTVTQELKGFITTRLMALVNISEASKAVPAQFTHEECMALKVLAASVMRRDSVRQEVVSESPGQPTESDKLDVKTTTNTTTGSMPFVVLANAPAGPTAVPTAPPAVVATVQPPAAPPTPAKRPKARKAVAPPSFLKLEPVARAAPAPVSAGVSPQTVPGGVVKLSDRTYPVMVVDEDGNTSTKQIRLNVTQQVRPAADSPVQPFATPNQYMQDQINARAEGESAFGADLFVQNLRKG